MNGLLWQFNVLQKGWNVIGSLVELWMTARLPCLVSNG